MARLLATHGLVRLIRQQEQIYRANDGTYKTILTKTMHTYFSRHNKNSTKDSIGGLTIYPRELTVSSNTKEALQATKKSHLVTGQ